LAPIAREDNEFAHALDVDFLMIVLSIGRFFRREQRLYELADATNQIRRASNFSISCTMALPTTAALQQARFCAPPLRETSDRLQQANRDRTP